MNHNVDPGDADRVFADVLALPEDFPGRPKLAAAAVTGVLRRSALRGNDRIPAARRLATIADLDPDPLPAWPKASAAVHALTLLNALQHGEPGLDLTSSVRQAEQH